jgi:beta-fructofuranosidase
MSIYRRPKDGAPAGDAIPFTFDGVYHLFHLSSPPGTVVYPHRVRTTWRHVRSCDLLTWEELPPALRPGEAGEPDADGVWTGSLVEADGVFHVFYTGHKLGSDSPQTICHATSSDLVHFEKDPANPVLRPTSHFEAVDWRDPFLLWNEEEQVYWMLIACRLRAGPKWRRGCIALATSPDLITWSVEPAPLYAPMNTYCLECPELFELKGRWYLVYSRFSEDAATVYRIADDPRGPWRVPDRETFDGRRWYAAKSMPTTGARVFFGWVHDRDGATDTGAWLWGGDFTVPREVTATASGALQARLPKHVADSFDRPLSFEVAEPPSSDREKKDGALQLGDEGRFAWRTIDVPATEYLFTCRFRSSGAPATFGLLLRPDSDLAAHAIVFDRMRRTVSLVRWPPPLDSFWADLVGRSEEVREVDGPRLVEHPLDWSLDGAGVECQLLISGSIAEFYVNHSVAMTYRIYGGGLHQLGVFVDDGSLICDGVGVSAATFLALRP